MARVFEKDTKGLRELVLLLDEGLVIDLTQKRSLFFVLGRSVPMSIWKDLVRKTSMEKYVCVRLLRSLPRLGFIALTELR